MFFSSFLASFLPPLSISVHFRIEHLRKVSWSRVALHRMFYNKASDPQFYLSWDIRLTLSKEVKSLAYVPSPVHSLKVSETSLHFRGSFFSLVDFIHCRLVVGLYLFRKGASATNWKYSSRQISFFSPFCFWKRRFAKRGQKDWSWSRGPEFVVGWLFSTSNSYRLKFAGRQERILGEVVEASRSIIMEVSTATCLVVNLTCLNPVGSFSCNVLWIPVLIAHVPTSDYTKIASNFIWKLFHVCLMEECYLCVF